MIPNIETLALDDFRADLLTLLPPESRPPLPPFAARAKMSGRTD